MKKLLRFLLVAAVVAAVVWATREQMLPKPAPPDHHPPPFRKPPETAASPATAPDAVSSEQAEASADAEPDDLQRVKGIGPVYEGKLHGLGIRTFSELIGADSESVAADLNVQVAAVVDWKTQATEFLS